MKLGTMIPLSMWQPDTEAAACNGCGVPFTFWRRRHHCRSCGLVVCGSCSSRELELGNASSNNTITPASSTRSRHPFHSKDSKETAPIRADPALRAAVASVSPPVSHAPTLRFKSLSVCMTPPAESDGETSSSSASPSHINGEGGTPLFPNAVSLQQPARVESGLGQRCRVCDACYVAQQTHTQTQFQNPAVVTTSTVAPIKKKDAPNVTVAYLKEVEAPATLGPGSPPPSMPPSVPSVPPLVPHASGSPLSTSSMPPLRVSTDWRLGMDVTDGVTTPFLQPPPSPPQCCLHAPLFRQQPHLSPEALARQSRRKRSVCVILIDERTDETTSPFPPLQTSVPSPITPLRLGPAGMTSATVAMAGRSVSAVTGGERQSSCSSCSSSSTSRVSVGLHNGQSLHHRRHNRRHRDSTSATPRIGGGSNFDSATAVVQRPGSATSAPAFTTRPPSAAGSPEWDMGMGIGCMENAASRSAGTYSLSQQQQYAALRQLLLSMGIDREQPSSFDDSFLRSSSNSRAMSAPSTPRPAMAPSPLLLSTDSHASTHCVDMAINVFSAAPSGVPPICVPVPLSVFGIGERVYARRGPSERNGSTAEMLWNRIAKITYTPMNFVFVILRSSVSIPSGANNTQLMGVTSSTTAAQELLLQHGAEGASNCEYGRSLPHLRRVTPDSIEMNTTINSNNNTNNTNTNNTNNNNVNALPSFSGHHFQRWYQGMRRTYGVAPLVSVVDVLCEAEGSLSSGDGPIALNGSNSHITNNNNTTNTTNNNMNGFGGTNSGGGGTSPVVIEAMNDLHRVVSQHGFLYTRPRRYRSSNGSLFLSGSSADVMLGNSGDKSHHISNSGLMRRPSTNSSALTGPGNGERDVPTTCGGDIPPDVMNHIQYLLSRMIQKDEDLYQNELRRP